MLKKVISGGQTGVDQAALRAAIDAGILTGGWCPPDCRSEKGLIPDAFGLKPTPENASPLYKDVPRSRRTEWNVRDSHGTLIFLPEKLHDPGTETTICFTSGMNRPCFRLKDFDRVAQRKSMLWIRQNRVQILNVAGPAESVLPGIEAAAYQFLFKLFCNLST